MEQQTPITPVPEATTIQPVVQAPKKSSSKLPMIIISLLLLVIIIGGGVFAYVYINNQNNAKKEEETKQEDKKTEDVKTEEDKDEELTSESAQKFRDDVNAVFTLVQEHSITENDIAILDENATEEESNAYLEDIKAQVEEAIDLIEKDKKLLDKLGSSDETNEIVDAARDLIDETIRYYEEYSIIISDYLSGKTNDEELGKAIDSLQIDSNETMQMKTDAFKELTSAFVEKYNLDPIEPEVETDSSGASGTFESQDSSGMTDEEWEEFLNQFDDLEAR